MLWILAGGLLILFVCDLALTYRVNDIGETVFDVKETIAEIEADIGTMQTKIARIEQQVHALDVKARSEAVQQYKGVPKL